MPYIKQAAREFYRYDIQNLIDKLKTVNFPKGDVNYIVSMIVGSAYLHKPSYDTINDMDGALTEAAREFFRRVGSPHERIKILQNGDIEVYNKITKYFDEELEKVLPVENSK